MSKFWTHKEDSSDHVQNFSETVGGSAIGIQSVITNVWLCNNKKNVINQKYWKVKIPI